MSDFHVDVPSRPAEPRPDTLRAPLLRLLLATRLAFLGVTLIAVLIGLAGAHAAGIELDPAKALATLFFALIAHAAANVINDYHDRDNDARNDERVYPFTGGSRFIQNGLLSPAATARLGYGLWLAVVPAGLWLAAQSGAGRSEEHTSEL